MGQLDSGTVGWWDSWIVEQWECGDSGLTQ